MTRPNPFPSRADAEQSLVAEARWAGYNIVILLFCLAALGLMLAAETIPPNHAAADLLAYADLTVCGIFFVDFLVSLARAENKWRYLVTWGWIDLLSSIPAIDVARWGKAARILRLLRIVRGIKATRIMLSLALRYRARNAMLAGSFIALLVVFSGSFAILQFEQGPEANIKTPADAVWWAVCTVTTVGYGDRYPVTWQGRATAGVLMVTGVGIFGALAGVLAGWFTGAHEDYEREQLRQLGRLADEMAEVRQLLEAQRVESRQPSFPEAPVAKAEPARRAA
ncbi:ion transporter [bacterium]|nr:ion transporter [bacterium]